MVEKPDEPSWWLKDDEPDSPYGGMILGGVFGFLIGTVIVITFSKMLVSVVGLFGIYVMAFCFVILGAGFGWMSKIKEPVRKGSQEETEWN